MKRIHGVRKFNGETYIAEAVRIHSSQAEELRDFYKIRNVRTRVVKTSPNAYTFFYSLADAKRQGLE